MRRFTSYKALELARIIKAQNSVAVRLVADSFLSVDLLNENRRIARHLTRRGLLAANEAEFVYHAESLQLEKPRFHADGVPHFCNDCAHQGNHTPQQLSQRLPWSDAYLKGNP